MDASLKWCSTPPLWHTEAVGGVHPIGTKIMRAKILLGCLAMAGAAQAQQASEPPNPRLDTVVSVVTLDFDGDGDMDRAALVQGKEDDDADLFIYLAGSDPNDAGRRELALVKESVAWIGGMWGTLPILEASPKGSLLLRSQNDAIGRSRWSQTLTIIRRGGRFLVAGFTMTSRDTLEPNSSSSCDVNLLSGQAVRNGKKLTTTSKPIELKEWDENTWPKECRF